MKLVKAMQNLSLVVLSLAVMSVTVFAQELTPSPTPQQRERVSKNSPTENPKAEPQTTETPTEPKTSESPVPTVKTDATPQTTETAEDLEIKNAIVPHYVNYLSKYELGPEDVISIEVFGQCDKGLCKVISISPTAIVNFPFIPGGIFVGGKTTDQVAKEIAKKLDEYIIDPQVTVNLEKVMSAQFAVLGKVAAPGVRTMTRRYSVVEAVVESGGFIQDADKKRISVMRRNQNGSYNIVPIEYDKMVIGKVPMEYLAPGDQVIIPEKKWSWNKVMQYVGMVSGFRALAPVPGQRF